MRALILDFDSSWLVKAIKRARLLEEARTGLHLTTITNDLADCAYPPRKGKPLEDGLMLPLQEFGNALEDIIARELASRAGWQKPKPRTLDGITCSPDGVMASSRTLDEMKATWVQPLDLTPESMQEFLEGTSKGFRYTLQTDSYAYVWELERIRLHILFVRGVKKGPPLPTPITIIRRRTRHDLHQTWRQVRGHAIDRHMLNVPRR